MQPQHHITISRSAAEQFRTSGETVGLGWTEDSANKTVGWHLTEVSTVRESQQLLLSSAMIATSAGPQLT
eukprot:12408924-Karenia_brevis.AAC.1